MSVEPVGKAMRIIIMLDASLLDRVDRALGTRHTSHSTFLADIACRALRDLADARADERSHHRPAAEPVPSGWSAAPGLQVTTSRQHHRSDAAPIAT